MKYKAFSASVLGFCILGLATRLIFALLFHPWNLAPDQLAWEILLQEGTLSYAQLIHYPHEGGSIVVSLLSKVVLLFKSSNSLVISALLIDFFSRLIQLGIVHRFFSKRVFYFFGAWQIIALPFILPWSSVNYGLHSLISFFPFLLLWFFHQYKDKSAYFYWFGLFLGIAFWFHYSNICLILTAFAFFFLKKTSLKQWLISISTLSIVLLFHFFIRFSFDAGFHLTDYTLSSIRGTSIEWGEIETYKRLIKVYYQPIADLPIAGLEKYDHFLFSKYLWFLLLAFGILGYLKNLIQQEQTRSIHFSFFIIPIFLVLYALSPFYFDSSSRNPSNYIAYRHLTYVTPFLFLLIIFGLNQISKKIYSHSLLLGICIVAATFKFLEKPKDFIATEATGWVLAYKMGHNPSVLSNAIEKSKLDKSQLYKGVGWGVSSAIMPLDSSIQMKDFDSQVIFQLYSIFNQLPKENSCDLMEGVFFAFSDYVTPQLEELVFPKVLAREEILSRKKEREKSTSIRENSSNP